MTIPCDIGLRTAAHNSPKSSELPGKPPQMHGRLRLVHGSGDLPSGDVTFVFTDIEGSTALLRELGDSYAGLLDRHREILRKAWNEYGGHELGTEGDSFLVAFADPAAAVEACVSGHVGLAAEPWVHGASVRVRMPEPYARVAGYGPRRYQ